MQQLLDAFGINWKLLLAQAVNFGIVLVALRYFLYTPVLTAIQKRRDLVAKGVVDAEEATRKLAGADSEADKRVRTAETKAEEIVVEAREYAAGEKTKLVHEAEERAAAIEKDAEARAQETQARALRDSEKEVARLAILAAEKVLRQKA